jgi:hypothetical protein
MFTVEMDTDGGTSCTITTLDSTGGQADVEVMIYDDMVAIRQCIDVDNEVMTDLIVMSPMQWADIINAMQMPSGSYYTREVKLE